MLRSPSHKPLRKGLHGGMESRAAVVLLLVHKHLLLLHAPGFSTCCQETADLMHMVKHKNRQSPCSCGAVPQQDLAHAMGHTALHGARQHQSMTTSTSVLWVMGLYTPDCLHPKETRQADLKCGPTQLRGCHKCFALGTGQEEDVLLAPCCQTTLSTTAWESQSYRQHTTTRSHPIFEV